MEITSAHMQNNSLLVSTDNFLQYIPIRGRNVRLEEMAPGLYRLLTPNQEQTFHILPNQVRVEFENPETPALGRSGMEYPNALVATSAESIQWFAETLSNLVSMNAIQNVMTVP